MAAQAANREQKEHSRRRHLHRTRSVASSARRVRSQPDLHRCCVSQPPIPLSLRLRLRGSCVKPGSFRRLEK